MLHAARPTPPRLQHIPREIASVADYPRYARERLDSNAWAYLSGAAGDGLTAQDNRQAFDRLRLLPRVLAEVSHGLQRSGRSGQRLLDSASGTQ